MKTLTTSLLLLLLFAVIPHLHSQDNRPDIVLLLADDVSPRYIYGGDTPNLHALASGGVLFRKGSAWATAMCAPTRHALMTGCFADETGVRHNELATTKGKKGIEECLTVAKVMKSAGYDTHYFGKWGVRGIITDYDSGLLWESSLRTAGLESPNTGSRYWHPAITDLNGSTVPTEKLDFGPDVFTDAIVDTLQNPSSQPKFIFYSMVEPHGERDHDYPQSPSSYGVTRKARYEKLIRHMDKNIGRIIAAKTRPTIFFFIGDNATAKEGKQEGVERGCEVPVIIGGDGIYSRGSEKDFFSIVDFLPTVADFAEYDGSLKCDGISLKAYLTGEYHLTRKKMFSNIGATQLAKKGKYTIQSRDKVRGNRSGDFYRGNKLLKRKNKTYRELVRYSTNTGGQLPSRGSRVFRHDKSFIKFWISAEKKEGGSAWKD
jgi:arylsulfatase A